MQHLARKLYFSEAAARCSRSGAGRFHLSSPAGTILTFTGEVYRAEMGQGVRAGVWAVRSVGQLCPAHPSEVDQAGVRAVEAGSYTIFLGGGQPGQSSGQVVMP